MLEPITGIHHITAIASDPQQNLNFYHQILGQRFIKSTINFDDPNTHHFYFGDRQGTPGTILTFFPWAGARRGKTGAGETSAIAYAIRSDSVDFWVDRLRAFDVSVDSLQTRFGQTVIPFIDPDGMRLELITEDRQTSIDFWQDGPIPKAHALQGFHGVTLLESETQPTAQLLTEIMGYKQQAIERDRIRFQAASNSAGIFIDLLHAPGQARGRMGAGSVHHIAFRARNDQEQANYQSGVAQFGLSVTPVRDRQYFRSIYFREPGGVLFEIATDDPGFTIDETIENLGTSLKLPPWLESQRSAIEQALPPIRIPKVEYV